MSAKRMTDIPFSGIRDIFEECSRLENDGRDIVHLEMGRPDFDTPQPIKDAAAAALADGEVHYTSNWGIQPLREEISNKYQTDYNLGYDPDEEIVVTSGATEAILVTILALVDPGDEVLVPDPCWTYAPGIRMAGGTPVSYRLNPDDDFQPDVNSIRASISEDTTLLVVNSPHNPTGGILTEDSAEMIGKIAGEHDLFVLSDEIYEKITYSNPHIPLASVPGLYDRTITISGFSKAYSMTGWRLGYAAAPSSVMDPIIRARQYTSTCANSFAQHGGVRALREREVLVPPLVNAFEERRDVLLDRINSIPGMTCPEPQGAFYAMPTTPEGVTDERAFARSLLQEAGVATVPSTVFSSSADGRIRIAYTASVDRINEAFDRIEAWL